MKEPVIKEPTITVTKLDAAQRQLRTAIRLWFTGGDPVAIHTLASASHEIIHTLFRRKGLRGLWFDAEIIREEHRGDWAKLLKGTATFFKHAQRDPDGEIQFNTGANIGLLLAGVHGLKKIGEPLGFEESTLMRWFFIHYPHWFISVESGNRAPVNAYEDARGIDKSHFFHLCELHWRQSNVAARGCIRDTIDPDGHDGGWLD